jgi:two-component system NtrC family response regulator
MKLLLEYEWPGNVRELANVVERAMLLSAARDEIVADDFPLSLRTGSIDRHSSRKSILPEDDFRLDTIVRSHIEKVLRYTGENKSKAARLLGISRKKFYQKLDGSS